MVAVLPAYARRGKDWEGRWWCLVLVRDWAAVSSVGQILPIGYWGAG